MRYKTHSGEKQGQSRRGCFSPDQGVLLQKKSVLVVDDEPVILGSLDRELTSAGLRVTTAAGGEEAVTLFATESFDLVTTDLFMPKVNGLKVLEAAKGKSPETMVIVLTGQVALEPVIDALRLGADDFLHKPYDTDELLHRISKCFDKQDALKKKTMYENLLSVCRYCKKIREYGQAEQDKGSWYTLEEYFTITKGVAISHGCCPDCFNGKAVAGKSEKQQE
jgi:DNA-binding response OmpR family regulator